MPEKNFVDFFTNNPKYPKIHSHNDYEREHPFYGAYDQKAYNIEADIWSLPKSDLILLGHNFADENKVLKTMYLQPIADLFEKNNGHVSAEDATYTFTLMLDVKTEAYTTLRHVVKELTPYRKYFDRKINPAAIRVVISGNRPEPKYYDQYPDYIYFDGRPEEISKYDSISIKRVGFISDSHIGYADSTAKANVTRQVNNLAKEMRFWGTPDNSTEWEKYYNYSKSNMILINTDNVAVCRQYFLDKVIN